MQRLTKAQRRQIRKKAGKETGLEWRLPGHQKIGIRAVRRAMSRTGRWDLDPGTLVGRVWPPDALLREVIEKSRRVGHVLMGGQR